MNYYSMSEQDLGNDGKIPLLKLGDSGEVFYEIALEMVQEIKKNNNNGKKTVFICPVGPVGQYPIFVRLVNSNNIDLKNCWFINMDEYLTDGGEWIDINNPLSFRRFMQNVYDKIKPQLCIPKSQCIFPDPQNLQQIPDLIESLGGVDIAFGGIGINGHLAFNEPQPALSIDEYASLSVRTLDISLETRTTNSIGELNGALEAMPKKCITIGIKEILSAKKIRLGIFRDWHRAVVRRALYDIPSSAFPVTLCQNHPDTLIIANSNAVK